MMLDRRCFLSLPMAAAAPRRPNILFILADDLGSNDLSSYNAPDIRTPQIDSIGRRGVRFTQCYANAPECTPTRAGLLTGRYQQRVGGLECAIGVGNVGRYDEAEWLAARHELGLPASESELASGLKRVGYATCLSGKWHLGYEPKFHPNAHGFDEYFGILGGNADYFTHREESGGSVLRHNRRPVERKGYLTDLITDHALGWLDKRRSGSKPWFLYLAYTAPHTPLQGPGDGPVTAPGTWNQGTRETYVRMVEHMDRRVGDLLAWLDSAGVARDTIVVFQSDNGGYNRSRNNPFRGGKSTLWEGGIRVPCLLRWPTMLPEASTTAQPAMTMDFTATLLAAAGARPRRPLDGIDLLPILTGRAPVEPRTLFWSYKRGEVRRWAVRHHDVKYVEENGKLALYNLTWDSAEKVNLAEPEPKLAAEMKARLDAWRKEVAARSRTREMPGFSSPPGRRGELN